MGPPSKLARRGQRGWMVRSWEESRSCSSTRRRLAFCCCKFPSLGPQEGVAGENWVVDNNVLLSHRMCDWRVGKNFSKDSLGRKRTLNPWSRDGGGIDFISWEKGLDLSCTCHAKQCIFSCSCCLLPAPSSLFVESCRYCFQSVSWLCPLLLVSTAHTLFSWIGYWNLSALPFQQPPKCFSTFISVSV